MINKITVTNQLLESTEFNLRSPETSGFFIKSVEGLGPVKATINTSEALSLDGGTFNSARLQTRNIVFKTGFLENPTIEDSRQKSYQVFPLKSLVTILVETDNRTVRTFGYVESNEPDIFSKEEGNIVSIICPDSYFHTTTEVSVDFSTVTKLFAFPFSNESLTEKLIVFGNIILTPQQTIEYLGEAAVGFKLYIHATGNIHNLSIFNLDTRDFIKIDSDILVAMTGSDVVAGDDIVISTIKGEKFVTLIRSGEEYNILNAVDPESSWFTLVRGDNVFYYTTDAGTANLQVRIQYDVLYEGI